MRFSLHGPYSSDDVQKFLAATAKRYARDGVAQWAVIEKESGHFVGTCGISMQVIGEEQKEYELGYRLSRKYWGKGFATEAAIACRDCGLNTFGLRRLISIIEAANHQSIRVAEKVGMTFEKKSTFHGIAVEIYALEKGHDRSERRESRGWGPAVAPSWTLETARDATK